MTNAVTRAQRVIDLMTEVSKLTPGIQLKLSEWQYLINRQVHKTNLRDREILAALHSLATEGKTKKSPLNRWYLL